MQPLEGEFKRIKHDLTVKCYPYIGISAIIFENTSYTSFSYLQVSCGHKAPATHD